MLIKNQPKNYFYNILKFKNPFINFIEMINYLEPKNNGKYCIKYQIRGKNIQREIGSFKCIY